MKAWNWARHATLLAAIAAAPVAAVAADRPAPIEWKATDCKGKAVAVPIENKTSILLFVMADQAKSKDALAILKEAAPGAVGAQIIVIVSGDHAREDAARLCGSEPCPWPVVADPDYAATNRLGVSVWPTTVIVGADGQQIAHLAGTPKSFARDLDSYLAFAAGRIDRAGLEKRLAGDEVVVDSPEQVAARHLKVAQRLLDKGLVEEARRELSAGLKLHPDSVPLRLALARLMLAAGENQEAVNLLEKISGIVPGGQLDLLRGTALGRLGKYEQAKSALLNAVKLNPYPADAYYQLGQILEKQSQWPDAADAYRKAFEATEQGKRSIGRGTK